MPLLVRPNVFLVFAVVVGFFIARIFPLLLLLFLEVAWLGYSPFFEIEYLILVCIGLVSFFLMRFFFLRRELWMLLVIIGASQIIFWALMYGGGAIISISFTIELLYNILIGSVFYLFYVWLEKKFS